MFQTRWRRHTFAGPCDSFLSHGDTFTGRENSWYRRHEQSGIGDMSNHRELKGTVPKRRRCVNSFFAVISDGLPRHMKYAYILAASVVDVSMAA